MNHRVAAAVCAAALLCTPVPARAEPAPTSGTASDACYNAIYLSRDRTLLRVDDRGAAAPAKVATFDAPLDAVAYVPSTRAFWAISGDRVISFDRAGRVTRRAPIPAALRVTDPIAAVSSASSAAAGAGDRWIVRTTREVVTYRMPALKEIDRHRLTGPGADILLPARIADWDADGGRLYTIASGPPAQLLRIDPHTGLATPIATPRGLPATGSFGAVVIDPQGTLHALHDRTGRLYHVTLDDPARATSTAATAAATRSDAAGCPQGWDYGDAPAPYATTHANNGPRHRIAEGLALGTTVTADADAPQEDQDDALAKPAVVEHDGTLTVEITATNRTAHNALVAAWHDLDGNGRFDRRDLATAAVRPSGRTPRTLTLTWRTRPRATTSTLRIRLYGGPRGYDAPTPRPIGPGDSGEVEDHPITTRPARPSEPAGKPPDVRNLAAPGGADAIPDPGAAPVSVPLPERRHRPVATATTPRERHRLPLTWSVFVGLLVPAASVAARAAAKRGSR